MFVSCTFPKLASLEFTEEQRLKGVLGLSVRARRLSAIAGVDVCVPSCDSGGVGSLWGPGGLTVKAILLNKVRGSRRSKMVLGQHTTWNINLFMKPAVLFLCLNWQWTVRVFGAYAVDVWGSWQWLRDLVRSENSQLHQNSRIRTCRAGGPGACCTPSR